MLSENRVLDELPDGQVKLNWLAQVLDTDKDLILEILRRLERKGCVRLKKPFLRDYRVEKTGIAYVEATKTLAVLNLKGGVGKTITSLNLASCIADLGHRVLLVDLDPQSNTTTSLKVKAKITLYDVLVGSKKPDKAIHRTRYDNLDLMPSEIGLAGAEVEIVGVDAAYRLWEVLEWVKDDYQFIIVDCPPSLSLLSVNALTAADSLLVPVQCDQFALESLDKLLETVDVIKNVNEDLRVEGILLTMYDESSQLSNEVARQVKKKYGKYMYGFPITRDEAVGEAAGKGVPVTHYPGASDAGSAYIKLAKEVVDCAR